ncbi:hypothetical protein BCR36DRAFT_366534 [Piromyces finnis]|uniref:Uncharacterized protein n=1 Tax=Piromyces finnis TaxID=1754191 RepID=A0A1Y1VLK8_9FUNG|nr:hypothetical protein BCR36DRAFT_366534 [Piromyces finnis]|eukprot:ORX59348.1 hypothetical protein BCR36DRAFT_366534 [Piromyces finnis]
MIYINIINIKIEKKKKAKLLQLLKPLTFYSKVRYCTLNGWNRIKNIFTTFNFIINVNHFRKERNNMNSKTYTKTRNKNNIRKIEINGKSKSIKKTTSFFGKLFGKLQIYKFSNKNRTKLIKDKNLDIQKKMEKEIEIEKIKNKNITPQDANTIFSFYSHENKKSMNNNNEFLEVLKTVENSINDNLQIRNSETKTEKIKRTFLNLLDTSKSFISFGNNNDNNVNNPSTSKSDITNPSEYEKILPPDIGISENYDEETYINNTKSNEFINNEREQINKTIKSSFHFWRSKSNSIDSDDENDLNKNNKIEENKITDIDSSVVTSNTEVISPNRVLLSESYYQSKQPRKFNSLSNLYFKNSNKQLSKYFSDVNLKYVNFYLKTINNNDI